jgi:hypothetical protein
MIFLMEDLKVCMLLMKYKIYHYQSICLSIHKFLKIFLSWEIWKLWLTRNKTCNEQLLIECNVLQKNITNINLKLSLFQFLFPHENGAYDGKIPIHEYLKYPMSSFFTIYMYKPYLLIMYDLWQSIQLIEKTSNTCFKKS